MNGTATDSIKPDASVPHPRTAEPCPSKRASGEKGIFRYAPEPFSPEMPRFSVPTTGSLLLRP